jgi:glycosyltransferase involved in cell wall biosynthesis
VVTPRTQGSTQDSAQDLAARLVGVVTTTLADLEASLAPGLRLPGVLAGHTVGADARADLIFVLGLLHRLGVDAVAGLDVATTVHERLAEVDPAATHTFFSYRVAETTAALGGLGALDDRTAAVVAEAADSTDWIELLDGGALPRNYAVVLARCEAARAALGIEVDRTVLEGLLGRAADLLGEHPRGILDDSTTGRGQVDMYTVDAYLFAEPLSAELGDVWDRGVAGALDLVGTTATPDGSALAWGRSIGVLAVCHTVELAALALRRDLVEDRARWLGLAATATHAAPAWFARGLVTSHQHRSPFRYRGPHRRLQMTLDCLGKLAQAALDLEAAADALGGLAPAPPEVVFDDRDRWFAFDERGGGVWVHRSPGLALQLPVVGGVVSDYGPAPRDPGRFEVPVDRPLLTWVPVAHVGDVRHGPGGRAAEVEHAPGSLTLVHDRFLASQLAPGEADPRQIGAHRRATYEVQGRSLVCDDEVRLDEAPTALAWTVPEAAGRPLHVRFETDAAHHAGEVDVDGLTEWRSVFGELPRVHQLDLEPTSQVRVRWEVTPAIRVVASDARHWYHRSLYDPLAGRVADRQLALHLLDDPDRLAARLRDIDVLHLHWPEWCTGLDPDRARRVAEAVHSAGVRIAWTQHNRAPHHAPDDDRAYHAWAEAADLVLHHSEWGMAEMRARLPFRDDALHRVVAHPHFASLGGVAHHPDPSIRAAARTRAEAELGLAPVRLRVGVVGAPRPGKDTALVIDGVARCRRDDVGLLVLSGDGEEVPDDPRITVLAHEHVDRDTYEHRLACIDVLVLPLEGGSYLTTGQVADAVGAGLPALVSPWPYLHEVLGDAAIPYGRTADELAATLDGLDDDQLDRASLASRELRDRLAPEVVAEDLHRALDELCGGQGRSTTVRPGAPT